jgi:hypothetical protein
VRLSAGIDLATLARRNIVSTKQMQQLEEGGDSSFYNDEIKFSIGKKILKNLGHDPIAEVQPSIENVALKKVFVKADTATVAPSSDENLPMRSSLKKASVIFTVVTSAVIVSGAAWFWVSQETHEPETSLLLQTATLKPEDLTNTAAALVNDNNSANLPEAIQPTEIAKPVAQVVCSWNNGEEVIQPDTPQKPSEYVHLLSQQTLTVCIMDGQLKVSRLNLQAGEGKSIYGTPPFKVYSPDLKAVKVYFQGQLVKLVHQETLQIKLNAADFKLQKN